MYKGFIVSSILPRLWCGTFRFYEKDTHGAERHKKHKNGLNLSVNACGVASSPNRGALGKTVNWIGLPKPPLPGEVALRSNDGEVVQRSRVS